MPIYTNIAGSDQPAPVESNASPGGFGAAVESGFQNAPSEVAAQAGVIALAGGVHVSKADATKRMTEQGYGEAAQHVPDDGLTEGALTGIMQRQSILRRDQFEMQRAKVGSVEQFIGGMIGGAPDPINAVAWIFAPEAKIGQGFLTKAAIGGAVQGGINAATSLAVMPLTHYVGNDMSMSDVFTQTALGVLLGGAHGFSKVPDHLLPQNRFTTEAAVTMENSAAAAAQHNRLHPEAPISADEVISPTGAVGLHQVEPKTARGLGLKGTDAEITKQLKNPATNKAMADKLLAQLANQFKNDPEAQAIAYNAGPKRANEWIKAGRDDSVLPRETQGYINRYREATGRIPGAAPAFEKPVVAYHGTDQDFAIYNPDLGGKFGASDAKGVTFFTSRPEVAGGYADFASLGAARGEGTNIRPVSMHMDNPREIDWKGEMYSATKFKAAIAEAKQGGYDGVVFKNVQDDVSGKALPSDIYAVFDANKNTKPYFGPHPVHDLPPQVQPDLLKTAVAQAGEDSKVNVEPVLQQSAAEAFGVKNPSNFDPTGLTQAIPTPGSQDHVPLAPKAAEVSIPKSVSATAEKGPLTSEAQEHLANDTAELKSTPGIEAKTYTADDFAPKGKDGVREWDQKQSGAYARAIVSEALANGQKVTLPEGKAIPITAVDTAMRDAKGKPWGVGAVVNGREDAGAGRLEIGPSPKAAAMDVETVAADNAIKQNEELHTATEAAVRCGLNRGLT